MNRCYGLYQLNFVQTSLLQVMCHDLKYLMLWSRESWSMFGPSVLSSLNLMWVRILGSQPHTLSSHSGDNVHPSCSPLTGLTADPAEPSPYEPRRRFWGEARPRSPKEALGDCRSQRCRRWGTTWRPSRCSRATEGVNRQGTETSSVRKGRWHLWSIQTWTCPLALWFWLCLYTFYYTKRTKTKPKSLERCSALRSCISVDLEFMVAKLKASLLYENLAWSLNLFSEDGSILVSPIDEFAPPTYNSVSGGAPMVTCRVCQGRTLNSPKKQI